MMKSRAFLLMTIVFFLALLQPGLAVAQVIQTTGTNTGVDYERLTRIDTMVNGYISRHWLNGAVTIVIKDNQVVQWKGYGFADVDAKTPMAKDEIFRIASQTKAITSTAILMLYEQGKLGLDEQVSHFIPEYKTQVVLDKFNPADSSYTTVAAKREITIRDLLTHTSGLDYPGIGSDEMRAIYARAGIPAGFGTAKENETLLSKMKLLAKLPLKHQPGEKWTYGLSCDLLGCIVEIVSGMNLEQFFTKNIFEPLGMKDSYFNVPAAKGQRLATVYAEDSLHHVIRWTKDRFKLDPQYPLMQKTYFSGGADLCSTGWDYAVFLQMILNGGNYNGHQILSHRSVEMMLSGQLDFMFNGTDNFGLGFAITTPKGAAKGPFKEGSFAWGGFFGSTYWADPKEHLVCVILTQQNPNSHGDISGKIEALLYASLKN